MEQNTSSKRKKNKKLTMKVKMNVYTFLKLWFINKLLYLNLLDIFINMCWTHKF